MKRFTICLFLAMLCVPVMEAGAAPANLVGTTLTSPAPPPAVIANQFVYSEVAITGDDSAETCIQRHASGLPGECKLVSYVSFWIDLPQRQRVHPQPDGGCPPDPTTCRFMGRDDVAPFGMVERYDGPAGRHVATVQVWRQVWGDAQPVLLGTDSRRFCIYHC